MKSNKTKKIELILLIVAIFQIILLMNMTTAHSYIIHQTNPLIENSKIIENNKENKIENLINSGINLLIGALSIKQIRTVSAEEIEDTSFECCPETNEGGICQNVASIIPHDDPMSCANPLPTNCDYVPDCEKGCCFDTEQGTCTPKATKQKCINDGGEWHDDEDCNIAECQKGCCVLGSNHVEPLITKRRCDYLSGEENTDNFRGDIITEPACLALSATQVEGACVLLEVCSRKTEAECLSYDGVPYPNRLCSNPDLEMGYEKQSYIGCAEDQLNNPGIYWFDDHNNRENIYSSDKDASWNNGWILGKENSCNPNLENIDSTTCGNCAPFVSVCSETEAGEIHVEEGDFVCKNLNCPNAIANGPPGTTQDRKNGERWCLYDGYIGDGKDTVGSEHWIAYCHDGKVEVDKCPGNYRGYICTQSVMEEDGKSFSTASCVVNEAVICRGYNSKPGMAENCKENKDCMIKNIHVDQYFKFDMCVPRYPQGFDLSEPSVSCSLATQTCIISCEKGFFSGWDCVNSNCRTKAFANQMNDLCISLGDCGSYVNYIGDGTDNGGVKTPWLEAKIKTCEELMEKWGGEPGKLCSWGGGTGGSEGDPGSCKSNCERLRESSCKKNELCSWEEPEFHDWGSVGQCLPKSQRCEILSEELCGCSETYVDEIKEQKRARQVLWEEYVSYAEPVEGQYAEPKDLREILGIILGGGGDYDPDNENDMNKALEKIGTISGASGTLIPMASWLTGQSLFYAGGYGFWTASSEISAGSGVTNVGGAFTGAAIGAVIGMYIGSWFAEALGISGNAANAMVIAGGTAGALGFVYLFTQGAAWTGYGALMALGAMFIIAISGWGKTKTETVTFECLPWTAPLGGENCTKCNENPLRPCTEYRCSSLGQMCKLLNGHIETENPECISMPYETEPPVISLGEVLTEGYEFQNEEEKRVKIREENGDCIQVATPILFTLETNEHAQCKYSFARTDPNYEDMEKNYPLEQTRFTTTHTFGFEMPPLDNPEVHDVIEDLMERYGNMNMYIRCQDGQDPPNSNIEEYVVNFCIDSGPDMMAVNHGQTVTEPENGDYLIYGTTEQVLNMWINKPAECKYDVVEDKSYDEMLYPMICKTGLLERELHGWPCNTTLIGLTTENNFYIKCKTKPWVVTNEDIENYGERIVNAEDFVYTLDVSESELEIDSIKISCGSQSISSGETITGGGSQSISVELEVETSGGMNNGISTCYWGSNFATPLWGDYGDSSSHNQPLIDQNKGDYNISIKCEDKAGNSVEGNITFTIEIDSEPPVITDQTPDGNNLILTTDEDAICAYNLTDCNFALDGEDAISISIMYSTEHTIYNLDSKLNYYVNCADMFDNANCTTVEATETDDGVPPIVVRAFKDYGDLKIITNKDAKCYYDFDGCSFVLEDGNLMTNTYEDYSTEHTADWTTGQTYYIKCIDDWGNENPTCAIKAKPSG